VLQQVNSQNAEPDKSDMLEVHRLRARYNANFGQQNGPQTVKLRALGGCRLQERSCTPDLTLANSENSCRCQRATTIAVLPSGVP